MPQKNNNHWQISYLSLKIGFSGGRLWDLNGCEYIWGIVGKYCKVMPFRKVSSWSGFTFFSEELL